jgi:hypothetical protein
MKAKTIREFFENSTPGISNIGGKEINFEEYLMDISDEINSRFDLTEKEIYEILDWYRDEIEHSFYGGEGHVNIKELVNSLIREGKLKRKR